MHSCSSDGLGGSCRGDARSPGTSIDRGRPGEHGRGGRQALRRPALAIDRPGARRPIAGASPAAPRGRYEYYFGATGGGLWKTDRRRRRPGAPVSDGFFKTSSVGAVAVAESNPTSSTSAWARSQLRGNVIQGDGVYKSTDAGKTWTHVGPREDAWSIARIRVHPTNPDVVYVAALGDPYGPNPERGVFKSNDGGKTWSSVLFRDDKTGAVDLVDGSEESRRALRRRSGKCSARRTRCRAAGRAAACSSPPTAARRGPS